MTNSTLVLSDLIDYTLDELYHELEKSRVTQLGAALGAATTTFTLIGYDLVSVTDLLEIGTELMVVTEKSNDANPTFTVIRGYSSTTAVAHTTSEAVLVNPYWTRSLVIRALQQYFTGPAIAHLPLIRSEVMTTVDVNNVSQQLIPLDSDVIRVLSVRYSSPTSARIIDLPGWRFEDNLPTAVSSTGMGLRVGAAVSSSDDLLVAMSARYLFTGTGEAATVDVPAGTEDIPPMYASCRLLSGREVSRLELDRLVESSGEQGARQGSNIGLVRLRWQEVYCRIDEAKRTITVPRPIVFRRFQRG